MTDEPKPGALAKFFGDLDLPKLLGGEGLKAISRLVEGAVGYGAPWLERAEQRVKDGTVSRSVVSKAIAEAAGKRVAEDPDLVSRALDTFLPRELRRQENKEAIARLAVALLANDPIPATEENRSIEEDWLNLFERYAEDDSFCSKPWLAKRSRAMLARRQFL